jgi:hypothetical protein
MWQHHILVCALFLVQGGKWTAVLLPRLLNIYLVRETLAKLDRHAGKMIFNLQIKNE